jgi:hypothetical protein
MDVAHVSIAGHPVRSSDELPEFAVAPSGALYAVWQDGRFSANGTAKIALSSSTDGGLHWSAPIRVDQSPGDTPAFTPQVHVAADGTVGVNYYDLENATTAQPGLTDAYIVHCHSATFDCTNPANWQTGGKTQTQHDRLVRHDDGTRRRRLLRRRLLRTDLVRLDLRPVLRDGPAEASSGVTDPYASTAG